MTTGFSSKISEDVFMEKDKHALLAMGSRVSDYEDAVMVESAKRSAMNAVVSRDGHMKDADIKIVNPGSLVSEIRSATGK